MRCLLKGRDGFVGGLGPVRPAWLGVCWRWSPVSGPCPQRPDRILAPAALAPLGPGSILPCSFSSHPRCCAAQCPSRHLHFVPFRPRSGRLDLQTSLSPFCILHSPFSTTRPPHTDTTLCKFLHPCHYQLCTYATQTAIRSTINLIFGCAPTVPSLTTRSSTLSAAWTRPGPNS